MKTREHLSLHFHTNLTDESKAYGYTLVIWGSGALLVDTFGLPSLMEVLLYITGAVVGFGLLAVAVYGGIFKPVQKKTDEKLVVGSMIHFIAALGTIMLSKVYYTADPLLTFFLVGVNASVFYNLFLLVEAIFFEDLKGIEKAIHKERHG